MKKTSTQFLVIIMIMVINSCNTPINKDPLALYAELDKNTPPNTLAEEEIENGWQLLFDGKSTKGWHGYNMEVFPDCWSIEDNAFTMNSNGGSEDQDIVTNEKYNSFAFSIEYKMTKAANSGIIFQVAEDTTYNFPYETGPEMQIIDQENWLDTLENWQLSGANYAMYPPLVKTYKPLDEWNHILIVVDSSKVTQILNGAVTAKYVKNSVEWNKLRNSGKWSKFPDWGKFDEGYISLQNHGTKVWFRNIKIKKL